jgi:hypothetical protein
VVILFPYKYLIIVIFISEQFVSDMRASNIKFVLVDEQSASIVRKAYSTLEWPVTLLSFGNVDGATSVNELLHDDGSGKITRY